MKRLGLIGWPLGHSWSKEIHHFFLHEEYEMMPLKEEELDRFLKEKDFDGINVTIPYKEKVIPYLDVIDEKAKEIGAVNCIVNQDGVLKGHNTDWEGLAGMLKNNSFDMTKGKTVILGSGGASKAAQAAVRECNGEAIVVSRTKKDGCITYEEMYENEDQYRFLINATPVGMFPNTEEVPVDLQRFTNLEGVVDIVANPLCTHLCFQAKMLGIPFLGGFEMLVRQAAAADRYFRGLEPDETAIAKCMRALYGMKRNIVLIGMPTGGKTTISKAFGEQCDKPVIEVDEEVEKALGTSIKECFETKGEKYFRDMESKIVRELRIRQGCIISCGGGIIKREKNMRYLAENGLIVWLKRDIDKLFPSADRPLSATGDALYRLYAERGPLYKKYADMEIENNGTITETIEKMIALIG